MGYDNRQLKEFICCCQQTTSSLNSTEILAKVKFLTIGKTYDLSKIIYLNRFASITGGARNNLGLYETVVQSLAEQAINVAKPNKVKSVFTREVKCQRFIERQRQKRSNDLTSS